MNWFRQNRFLGFFLGALVLATVLALVFLFHEMGAAGDQQTRLETTAAEMQRLHAGHPFPTESNLKKMRAEVAAYRDSLGALEKELQTRSFPLAPLQPSEFQAQLRQSVNALTEKAQANKVTLPANFNLGFDEYATSLPNPVAAPLLGRELKAVELLANAIVDARVDGLTSLTRTALPEEKPASSPTPTPPRGRRAAPKTETASPLINAQAVQISYSASPAAARRALNEIATTKEQLFIIRTLNIKSQAEKGPKREEPTATPTPAAPTAVAISPAPGATAAPPAVKFIVGTEHINVSAQIDIVAPAPSPSSSPSLGTR